MLLVGRGPTVEAIRSGGLRLQSPAGEEVLRIPIVSHPGQAALRPGDIVLLAVKSQDTAPALRAVAATAPGRLPVVCMQNGVANERAAARLFGDVYGMVVMCPAAFVEPGIVQAHSTPTPGIMDLGRYPAGVDETAATVAAALEASTFVAEPRPDVMRWKYRKLVMNLGNSVQALCGPGHGSEVMRRARVEGEAVLAAAGIDVVSAADDEARRGDILQLGMIAGESRVGGSTWQSLARGAGSVETDYLNGEIALLGRLHGVGTPVNALLQDLRRRAVRDGAPPGAMTEQQILEML